MDTFDYTSLLATDSEWLLLCGDASAGQLAEVLTREYYPLLYRLALMLTDDCQTARDCVWKVLAYAIGQATQYNVKIGVRAWLLGLDVQACRKDKKRSGFEMIFKNSSQVLDRPFNKAIGGLNQTGCLAFILNAFFEIPIDEIAQICRLTNSIVDQSLRSANLSLQAELIALNQGATPDQVKHYLNEFSNRRWPLERLTEQDLSHTSQELAAFVLRQESLQKHLVAVLQIIVVGLAFIIVLGVVRIAETILPSSSAPLTRTAIPTPAWSGTVHYRVQQNETLESVAAKAGMTVAELSNINTFSPTTEVNIDEELRITVPGLQEKTNEPFIMPSSPSIKPLTADSSPLRIRKMMRVSHRFWRTLWMDMQQAKFNHPGTHVHEFIRRQVWVQQPDRSYEILNYLSASNEMLYFRDIVLKGRCYYAIGSYSYFYLQEGREVPPGALLANPFLGKMGYSYFYLYEKWEVPPDAPLANPILGEMVFPGQSSLAADDRQLTVLGSTQIAGRQVLIVDSRLQGDQFERRIWIDMQTGIILRYQLFDLDEEGEGADYIVTKILFNINIPPALFDPRQTRSGGYAMDYSGWAPIPDSAQATQTPAIALEP